jgi:hypothetical protein
MAAMLGAGGLVGALLAPSLTEKISPFMSIASVFWILTVVTPAAVFIRNGYLLGALLFTMALLPPTANTTIMTRQLLITLDDLRGRLSGALGLITGGAGAVARCWAVSWSALSLGTRRSSSAPLAWQPSQRWSRRAQRYAGFPGP